MNLVLRDVVLSLGQFTLQLDFELTQPATAIFGPSGAGKTSLLDVLAGVRRVSSGRIELDGNDLTNMPTRLRRVGYVPQDLALFPHLSVRRNLLYGAESGRLEHVTSLLEIESLLERSVADLSGGERQRVALGRALLASPRLLLLDEPLASLDTGLKRRVIPYLKRIRDEIRVPMLYVSHDPDEVAELCDEIVVLQRGRSVARGPADQIFERTTELRHRLRL